MKEEFDFLNYINSRLLEIDDLNQRNYAKDILKDVFGELVNYSKTAINEVENRIIQEESENRDYTIVSGVASIDEFDNTNAWMFPMCQDDTTETKINLEELKSALAKGETYRLCTVMFDAPFEIVKELQKKEQEFSCVIKNDKWEYRGTCYIAPRTDYEKQYEALYQAFQRNGIKYCCPNVPYLQRFFNVFLKSADFYDIENIESVEIDFGEYKSYIKYDIFPVWNIEIKTFLSDVKPKPCENEKQFCHIVNHKRLRGDCSYLVEETKGEIYDVFFQEDLHIISSIPQKKKWKLYVFSQKKEGVYKHEFFSNKGRESGCVIRSKADVFRFVKMLNYEDYMVLKRVEILEAGHKRKQTYDMNFYITDYFPVDENKKQLCLYFENKRGQHPLLNDVLSYIITALQEECREYECIGIFM